VKYYRLNNKIIAPKIRLIDGKGNHLGEFVIEKALEMAREQELDLVEISPKANPPVVKIMDFGQFKYELKRKSRQEKKQQKTTDVKGIRLTPRIGEHDLEIRIKKAKKFLTQGHKIKVEMILKGREKAHFDLAEEKINNFIKLLGEEIKIEQKPKRQGSRLTALISPL